MLDERRFLRHDGGLGHAGGMTPAGPSTNRPVAARARSPRSGRSGSKIRVPMSLRSQAIWRLASWQVAEMARSRNVAASVWRSEEHTSELQSLMRNSYAGFCLK